VYIVKIFFLLAILHVNLISLDKAFVEDEILKKIAKKYKEPAKNRFYFLQKTLDKKKNMSDIEKLNSVNEFYNGVKYSSDKKLYNLSDYWANTFEFLGKDRGDCEDYVISKYFALIYLGVNPKKLFFTYVKSKKSKQPHMVLTYFKKPRSQPLVLDNLNRKILLASKRKDLTPIYNFNPNSLKKSKMKKTHKKWDELKQNMKKGKI